MWPNPQFPAELFTFTEEILNGKLPFSAKEKHLKFRSLDCRKMHFRHSSWLQKHSSYIVHKTFFSVNISCKYVHSVMFTNIAFACSSRNFCWSFTGSFEGKLTRKIHTTFLYVCLQVSKPKREKNSGIE